MKNAGEKFVYAVIAGLFIVTGTTASIFAMFFYFGRNL